MPADDADRSLFSEMLRTVEGLNASFREVRDAVDAQADALRLHRDVVFRSVNLLNHESVDHSKRIDTLIARTDQDERKRVERQAQQDAEAKERKEESERRAIAVDAKFATVINDQQIIKRWQWIRIGVEIGAILIVIAVVIARSL